MNPWAVSIGIILIVGTIGSYIPQMVILYNKKSVIGISQEMLFMGCLSSMFNLIGLIANNNFIEYLLPISQMFMPWICITIVYTQYIHYSIKNRFDGCKDNTERFLVDKENITWQESDYNKTKKLYPIYITVLSATITVWIMTYSLNGSLPILSNFLNIIATITGIIMWIPQILKSIRLKGSRNLSLLTLTIHAAGCVLTVIYQVGFENQSILVGLPFIAGAILEMTIVFICLHYKRKSVGFRNALMQ
jgi:uncharacterized protein with PQ loop repeat